MFLAATAFSVYASDTSPVNGRVLQAFKKEFSNASNVTWSVLQNEGLYEASFNLNDIRLYAFYTFEGEFVGLSHYIEQSNLPFFVSNALANKFPGYTVTSVLEHSDGGNTTYYLSLEGEKASLLIRSTPSGQITIAKKIKKRHALKTPDVETKPNHV